MRNNRKFIFRLLTVILALILVVVGSPAVFAETLDDIPYTTYTYWDIHGTKSPVETKAIYEVTDVLTGVDLGIESFLEIQHLFTFEDNLYVLDSGNGRVVILNSDYGIKEIITGFTYNGEEINFKGAKGIFVDESGLYIADTLNKRLLCSKNGEIFKIITKPDDPTIPATFDFSPIKLVRDESGYIYLLCEGSYYGMMVFSKDCEFFGFFGANNVTVSFGTAVKEWVLSLFETEEKHNASLKSLPFSLVDLCIDSEGFVAAINGELSGQLRRFGFNGTNTLTIDKEFQSNSSDSFNFADSPVMFQDKESSWGVFYESKFVALTADNEGYYYLIDDTHGRIFVYDNKCNVISIFGGGRRNGTQTGTFVSPSSITVFGDDLLVSDFSTGEITVFKRTEYGQLLMKANALLLKSKYEEAKSYWEEIYAQDKGCQLAYIGLAKAALKEKNYNLAMQYAKDGVDRETYSLAFEKVRNEFLSKNFVWIALIAIFIVAAIVIYIVQSKKRNFKLIKNPKLSVIFNFVRHPLQSLQDIKYKNMGSFIGSTVVLMIYYISSVLTKLEGGFMFASQDLSNFNAILVLLGSVGIVIVWTVANWLVCVLFEGKGKIKEIYYATCYSLIPIIVYNFLFVILSNFLIPSNNSPFELLGNICYILTAILLLLSITVIHDFNFFKAIGAALVTVLGMAIVAFVLFSMLTLWQDMIAFVIGIFNEITLR